MKASAKADTWAAHLQRFVHGAATQGDYLDALGGGRLAALAVSESTLV